jgi:hypothetical protein
MAQRGTNDTGMRNSHTDPAFADATGVIPNPKSGGTVR